MTEHYQLVLEDDVLVLYRCGAEGAACFCSQSAQLANAQAADVPDTAPQAVRQRITQRHGEALAAQREGHEPLPRLVIEMTAINASTLPAHAAHALAKGSGERPPGSLAKCAPLDDPQGTSPSSVSPRLAATEDGTTRGTYPSEWNFFNLRGGPKGGTLFGSPMRGGGGGNFMPPEMRGVSAS
jgi:hypothetical protein